MFERNNDKLYGRDFDELYNDDVNRKWFYSDYQGNKLVVGKISLNNAIARLNLNEYYTLVTYHEGDVLPEQYIPLDSLTSNDNTLFATVNPSITLWDICRNGGIQRITQLPDYKEEGPRYLLGPGPDIVLHSDLVMAQYEKYIKTQEEKEIAKQQVI